MTNSRPVLYVFAASHFCEKAMWGLDAAGVAYERRCWAPGLHVLLARRLGASRSTVPILVTERSKLIQGSDKILDWSGLKGGDPEVERRAEEGLAVAGRRLIYSGTLSDSGGSSIRSALHEGIPVWQRVMAGLAWPAIRRGMIWKTAATPDAMTEAASDVERELAWLDGVVSRTPYVTGPVFGRADITVASFLAPLARPVEHPIYARLAYPEPLERLLRGWKERPSLEWARRVYREQRWKASCAAGRG